MQVYATITGNQTDLLSPIHSADSIPFSLLIEEASFSLPRGLQTYVHGIYDGKGVCISGRISGLHGFELGDHNFPPLLQNTYVFVIDFAKEKVYTRSLQDKDSGLSQEEIDYLSTTAAQCTQVGKTLYMVGGYGVDTKTGQFSTKPILSAIDLAGLIHWVKRPSNREKAKEHIRFLSNPIFAVTGGDLYQITPHDPFLLIFGQNFKGFYTESSNGIYTHQIRSFQLLDDGNTLEVVAEEYHKEHPAYRRRDMNIVPIIKLDGKNWTNSLMALSGVFTKQSGIWTVPVFIDSIGHSYMPDPSKNSTFKQGMNVYNSAHIGLFSFKSNAMHTILLGGLSYEVYKDGEFSTDDEIPFNNNVTDIVIDKNGRITQHLMEATYPEILATFANPGNPLLFGAGARFFPISSLPSLGNSEVFSLDHLKKKTLLGYIVGGIMSTLPNTETVNDSAASPYIFKVFAIPK